VSDYRIRAWPTPELAGECAHERHTASQSRRRTVGSNPYVRRQVESAHRGAKHNNLVGALRERRDKTERVRKDGMISVERLRGEDDAHYATVRSTSSRYAAANSAGVVCQAA
jgi:hypothetical protein